MSFYGKIFSPPSTSNQLRVKFTEVSPEPLHKRGKVCFPTSCTLEKVSENQSRQKSASYQSRSTSRWFYQLRKMRRSLKATYPSQFKALLKPKTLCGRAYRTGVGKTSHMKSCAASVDNVSRLDCKRRHKQDSLCIGALNVRTLCPPGSYTRL
jgi:hypothetical protein